MDAVPDPDRVADTVAELDRESTELLVGVLES